jgi:hypothetical protein
VELLEHGNARIGGNERINKEVFLFLLHPRVSADPLVSAFKQLTKL